MISEKMKPLVNNNSAIRAMFEEGKRLAAIHGAENVYGISAQVTSMCRALAEETRWHP